MMDSTPYPLETDRLDKPIVHKMMEAARRLFFQFGTRKVSIEEICRDAGVSKMTFYRHFKDKEDIAVCVLQKHFRDRMSEYEDILNQDMPFDEKLKQILELKIKNVSSINDELLKEILTGKTSVIGKWLAELNVEEAAKTRELIRSAQAKGEIRSDVKVEMVLFVIEKTWDLLSDARLVEMYDSKAQMLRELNAVLYYGILSR